MKTYSFHRSKAGIIISCGSNHVYIKCSVVRRPRSAVCGPSSAVRRPPSAVRDPLFIRLLSTPFSHRPTEFYQIPRENVLYFVIQYKCTARQNNSRQLSFCICEADIYAIANQSIYIQSSHEAPRSSLRVLASN